MKKILFSLTAALLLFGSYGSEARAEEALACAVDDECQQTKLEAKEREWIRDGRK